MSWSPVASETLGHCPPRLSDAALSVVLLRVVGQLDDGSKNPTDEHLDPRVNTGFVVVGTSRPPAHDANEKGSFGVLLGAKVNPQRPARITLRNHLS